MLSTRRLAALCAAAAFALLAVGAATAGAHTVLRTDPGGGVLVGPNTVTSTTSDGFKLVDPAVGTLSCALASFDIDVAGNTSATTIPGVTTALTAQNCVDTFPAVIFTSCHLENTAAVHIGATTDGNGVFRITDPTLRCGVAGAAAACYFTAPVANGVYSNATATLAFENVPYQWAAPTGDALGPGPCGNNGTWSVTFTHVVQNITNQTLTVRLQ
jgi:hypothetical protein